MAVASEVRSRIEKDFAEDFHRIEISGEMDRHAVETLQLEIQRLAKRSGWDVKDFRIETVEDDSSA